MQAPWLENTAGLQENPVWDFSGVVRNLLGRPPLRVRFMLGVGRTPSCLQTEFLSSEQRFDSLAAELEWLYKNK